MKENELSFQIKPLLNILKGKKILLNIGLVGTKVKILNSEKYKNY